MCWGASLIECKSTSKAHARSQLVFQYHALRNMHIPEPNKHKQDLTMQLPEKETSVDEFKFHLDEAHQFIDDMMHKEDP